MEEEILNYKIIAILQRDVSYTWSNPVIAVISAIITKVEPYRMDLKASAYHIGRNLSENWAVRKKNKKNTRVFYIFGDELCPNLYPGIFFVLNFRGLL